MRHPFVLAALTSLASLTLSASALAIGGDTWATLSHDSLRSARSTGTGAILQPQVAWKYESGGSLNDDQIAFADVNSDTVTDMVYVSGGRIVARTATGQQLWSSKIFGAQRVVGLYDLDNAPPAEVIATGDSPAGVYVLSSVDGAVLWHAPTSNTSFDVFAAPVTTGGFRLLLAEQLGPLTAYSFASGLQNPSANLAWSSASAPWSVDMLTADVDGDKKPDLVRGADRGFVVYDLLTGAVKCDASSVITGTNAPSYFPVLNAADVNGDGRDELVVYDYSYHYSEDSGVFVVACNGSGATLTPQTLWAQQYVNDTDGLPGTNVDTMEVRYLAEAVANYDNKAGLEMVYSVWDATAATWTTYLVNAQTGSQLAAKSGEVLEAATDLDDDGMTEVVLREATGLGDLPKPYFSTLRLYNLNVGNFTNKGWTLPAGRVATLPARRARQVTAGCGLISAHQNIDADSSQEFFVFAGSPTQAPDDPRPGKLLAVRAADGHILQQYAFPQHVSGAMLGLGASIQQFGSKAESIVMLSDGGLRLLDSALAEFGNLPTGNWARLPAVVSLDGTHNVVVASHSTGHLVALDGTHVNAQSPAALWNLPEVIQPETRGYLNSPGLVLPAKAGASASIVVRARKTGAFEEQSLVALDSAGAPTWTAEIGTGRSVASFENFELLDDLDGDGVKDFFLTEIDVGGAQELVIRKGSDGSVMVKRATHELFAGADYLQGHASLDLNDDGKLDVVSALHPQWFVGIDVSAAGAGDPVTAFKQIFRTASSPNGQVMAGQLDNDSMIDLLRVNSQNAFGPYERRDLFGLVEINATSPHPNTTTTDTNTVALVARPGQPSFRDFVWAGMAGDALGAVARHDGESFTEVWFSYLAAGAAHPKAAPPDGRSALYVPVTADIDGNGEDEILVGSSDGWLYALGASDGAVRFSIDMKAPVVHVLPADVDVDPELELVVSLGDGTIVALDQAGKYTLDTGGSEPLPEAGPDGAGGSGGADAGSDGSAGAAGSAGGGAGQAGAAGSAAGAAGAVGDAGLEDAAAGAPPAPAAGGDDGGCGCRTTGGSSGHAGVGLIMALAAAVTRLRRR